MKSNPDVVLMADEERRSGLGRTVSYAVLRAATRCAAALVRLLSLRNVQRCGNAIGWLGWHLLAPYRRRVALKNLEVAFDDSVPLGVRKRIGLRGMQNAVKVVLELFKLPQLGPDELRRVVRLHGLEHLKQALEKGRGAIIVTAHFGNWEFFAARLTLEGLPLTVIARDATEAEAAHLINRCREAVGVSVLGRHDVRGALRALRSNGVLGILPDQHASEGGVVVEFFGRPVATAPGPAVFAARTGAPVLPIFAVRTEDETFEATVYPPLGLVHTGDRDADVQENTQRTMQVIEEQIRAHPEQWFWTHRRWKPIEGVTAAESIYD